ncbi:MAG TPA: helix-turn-helix transcriptional regulator [Pseudonocardiaceae bacterium]|nr:helix-turn-helix transcriptional regulator [Pseudonocardiaceae bacterium]
MLTGEPPAPFDQGTAWAILAAIGGNLKQARRAAGLTQAELGARAGIGTAVLCRLELGKRMPTLLLVAQVCAGLGTSPTVVIEQALREVFPIGDQPWNTYPGSLMPLPEPTSNWSGNQT